MEFKALGDKVFVKLDTPEDVTAGGIIIPDAAQQAPWQGTVVASGPGRTFNSGRFVENTVKPGDRVIVPRWATEVEIDGQKLIMVPEESVMAVLEDS